jgi:hypothetical protein
MKGDKLPKWMWKKGKSKLFYPRLKQEGIKFGQNAWTGDKEQILNSPMNQLIKKLLKS